MHLGMCQKCLAKSHLETSLYFGFNFQKKKWDLLSGNFSVEFLVSIDAQYKYLDTRRSNIPEARFWFAVNGWKILSEIRWKMPVYRWTLMWGYIFISIFAVNRRMLYAVAMNMDNTDIGITRKNRASLPIVHLAYKNGCFKTLCRGSICLCHAALSFFVG